MSSLEEIRDALADTIKKGVSTEVFAYPRVPDVIQLPALIVMPDTADFTGAFQRGLDEWKLNVYVLVSRGADIDFHQKTLDGFLTGAGPDSIRQVLYNDGTLGDVVIDAMATGVEGYGGEFLSNKIPHSGAIVKVVVRTDGAT